MFGNNHEYDRDRAGFPLQRRSPRRSLRQDHVGLYGDQLFRESPCPIYVAATPTNLHPEVATVGPTTFCKALHELGKLGLSFGVVFFHAHQHADAPHPLALLRPRRERPRRRPTAQQRKDLAPFTSSMGSSPEPAVPAYSSLSMSRKRPAGPWGRPEMF